MEKKYALKVVNSDMTTSRGFRWADVGGVTTAPDWEPTNKCGNGLHAWLNGVGDTRCQSTSDNEGAIWLVLEVHGDHVELDGKIKFQSATTVFAGCPHEAACVVAELSGETGPVIGKVTIGGNGCTLAGGDLSTVTGGDYSTVTGGHSSTVKGGHSSMVTGGDYSTVTGGDYSTVTGGDYSTVTGGHSSTVTGGNSSTVTGGYGATVTGGDLSTVTGGHSSTVTGGYGAVLLLRSDTIMRKVAVVGQNGIKPYVPYRLNDENEFEEVK